MSVLLDNHNGLHLVATITALALIGWGLFTIYASPTKEKE